MVTERDLTLDGEHTTQYTDFVLQNYTLETYIILSTNVTPIIQFSIQNSMSNKFPTQNCIYTKNVI